MKKKHFFIGCVILLSMVVRSNANAQLLKDILKDKADAKAFVQEFYDWYVVFYNKPFNKKNAVAPDEAAIKKRPGSFDDKLINFIIAEEWEHHRAKGKKVGWLDFDPFLAAKDNKFTYVAGDVKEKRYTFLVDLHSDIATKSKQEILAGKTTIIAEVIKTDGSWKFTNFYYPKGRETSNLIKTLASLRYKRSKYGN